MQRKNQVTFVSLNAIADGILIMLAYFLSVWLRIAVFPVFTDKPENFDLVLAPQSLAAALLSAVVMLVLYGFLGLYNDAKIDSVWREIYYIICANGLGVLVIGTALFTFRIVEFSRSALVIFYVFSCLFVYGKRVFLSYMYKRMRSNGKLLTNVVLVGSGELAKRYYQSVISDKSYGYNFCGYYSHAKDDTGVLPRYCGKIELVRNALEKGEIEEIVIAMPSADERLIGMLVSACGRFGVKVCIIPPYNDFIPSTPRIEPQAGLKRITVRSAPDKGLVWAIVKRAMDLAMSICGIVVLSPVLLITAMCVKFTSEGNVIFKQKRIGKNGKSFYMYKFRSMYADAEERLAQLQDQNESDGPTFKIANDPRITPVGRFIRKTSLDELPQLVNILKGDMSVVGPRPPLPKEVAQYSDWDWGRLTVKPGLTCFWQIGGRNDISFSQWMQLDLKYVEEQGFLTDVTIILKTFIVVFTGKGAY